MKNNQKLPPLIVILGPTASGKTGLSLKLAKKYNGEIISADSRQIYKEMNIGTDKIRIKNLEPRIKNDKNTLNNYFYGNVEGIPHYMIDIINPNQEFSVAEFKEKSLKIIKDIHNRSKIPFLVGGTGLYIQSIVDNLIIPKVLPNRVIRNELSAKSNTELLKILKILDPKSADKLDPNNRRRLIRAIEVCKISGKPFSKQTIKGKPLFNILQIGIKTDREKLYEKIDKRIDEMVKEGLINETKKLIKKYPSDLPSMSGIGYKEITEYLNNNITLEEAVQKMKYRTHQYAKRQITWFKRGKNIEWIKDCKEVENLITNFLK
jgi:tRNA dimethylallyltransferase